VGGVDEGLIVRQRTQVLVDVVEVDRAVPVVIGDRLAVVRLLPVEPVVRGFILSVETPSSFR
jgi:hypothetical protein